MNRIQFFYDQDIVALQQKINNWLSQNKDINIVSTNLQSLGKPSQRAGIISTEKYVFYILYIQTSSSMLTEERTEQEEQPIHSAASIQHLEGNISVGVSN